MKETIAVTYFKDKRIVLQLPNDLTEQEARQLHAQVHFALQYAETVVPRCKKCYRSGLAAKGLCTRCYQRQRREKLSLTAA